MEKIITEAILKSKIFTKQEISAIGLDVGNFSVKVTELRSSTNKFILKGIGFSPINQNDPQGVVSAIQNAARDAKVSTKKVNASIFPSGVIVRYLLLPTMTSEELKKAMNFEVERYAPFSRDDVVSDFQILKEDPIKKNMKILLVAAKKEFVEARVKLIENAGFEPQLITIDSLVLKNSFELNYPEKRDVTVGLLNIGSKLTNINIVRDTASYFMRDVQIGGDNISSLLKEKLGVSTEEAEKIKCEFKLSDQETFKIIEPVLGNLLNEIYLSFDYYESEFGLVVDEVFLSGGTAEFGWLREFLKENLGREIRILEPTKNLIIDSNLSSQKVTELSNSLAISIGLALETFN
ncbi:MAG: type IV pilus assembly protein PilM [Candidatus Omnitrophota bacterium]|nr:type IV pilus assembly protein PilM [Candidatus Omnitrophota bacterium]